MLDFASILLNLCLGAAAGYGVGWIHYNLGGESERSAILRNERRDYRRMLAVAGGVGGALVFAGRPGDRWQTVPVEVAAGADPRTGSATLALTVRFQGSRAGRTGERSAPGSASARTGGVTGHATSERGGSIADPPRSH